MKYRNEMKKSMSRRIRIDAITRYILIDLEQIVIILPKEENKNNLTVNNISWL